MNKNIIAISGTHGTGKSFQCYKLALEFKKKGFNVCVLDELARECPFNINQGADEFTQYWLISAQIKKELELSVKYDYIFTDRSLFDPCAYGLILNQFDESNLSFISNVIQSYYNNIFILDPDSFNYHISDGVRDMDVAFRYKVHSKLVSICDINNIKYHYITDENDILKHLDEILSINGD